MHSNYFFFSEFFLTFVYFEEVHFPRFFLSSCFYKHLHDSTSVVAIILRWVPAKTTASSLYRWYKLWVINSPRVASVTLIKLTKPTSISVEVVTLRIEFCYSKANIQGHFPNNLQGKRWKGRRKQILSVLNISQIVFLKKYFNIFI